MRVIKVRRGLNPFYLRLVRVHKSIIFSNNFSLLFELSDDFEYTCDARELTLILRPPHNQFSGSTKYPLFHSSKFHVLRVRVLKNRHK
ncbi:hypothetical protein BLA39750_03201 [Burkholderia lata]|uniref:Uncharacterized protein n=1 Tax=Burkholderia lata (strain ATCC 17760 / DSM 23089 / LMG 22485 / NCIMB 9086 / R18194 / 383) TaxID=482957 RepID=A0A6P2XM74_BURL3|nr:hypothetical protein BLA39750_03201 [Burkholderia lata]